MNTSKTLAGLVLCGGQSSRMGTDKGLLQRNGKTWAQLAADRLKTLQIPVFISIYPSQFRLYSTFFPEDQLITDSLPLRGPLAGLLTAHQCFPQTDWLVCACDLPDMTVEILTRLQQVYLKEADYQCFVFRKEAEWEPLCGIYQAKGLQYILDLYRRDKLPRHSMKHVLEVCQTYALDIPDEATWQSFKNYNSAAELE
jgi:molybdopterin-guanine dinucleotide biosynthesis protein A